MEAPEPQTPEAIVAAHPMMRVLRERHPDVDVVLLPDPTAQRVEGAVIPSATSDDLARLARATEHLLDAMTARLARHPAWPSDSRRESRWEGAAREGGTIAHREAVLVAGGLTEGDNIALLRAAGNAFLGHGWQARPVPGGRPRLVARRGRFTASAMVHVDSLQVTVSSEHVLVDAEDLR